MFRNKLHVCVAHFPVAFKLSRLINFFLMLSCSHDYRSSTIRYIPSEQRLLSGTALSIYKVVWVTCQPCSWLVFLRPRFSWGVNKPTTRLTSDANDFVNAKSHARQKPCSQGIQYIKHTQPTDMIHSDEEGTSALLSLYGSQSFLSTQFG